MNRRKKNLCASIARTAHGIWKPNGLIARIAERRCIGLEQNAKGWHAMRVGLIDVDAESRGKVTFPNLPLMKISAWHKAHGDSVEWYTPLLSGHMDLVYMARVFNDEYTQDYPWCVDADRVIKGGSGYAITLNADGKEEYHKELDESLPCEVEHIYPDYGLYGITDTAYGFLTRGCPRGCAFCHVKDMQGRIVLEHSPLQEFWRGQKNIVLLDPNITASKYYFAHMRELEQSGANVDFSQGLDARLLTKEKIEALNEVKWKMIHFAWDKPEEDLRGNFLEIAQNLQRFDRRRVTVYVLTNFGSTHQQDLDRVYFLRNLGYQPYVMIYNKASAPQITKRLASWCNNPYRFWSTNSFDDYKPGKRKTA